MLCVRLARGGMKNAPFYSIVVAEKAMARDGRFIEKLGHFNPSEKNRSFVIDWTRLDFWVKQGAQVSETTRNLFKTYRKKAS